jgi:hypothetical protein
VVCTPESASTGVSPNALTGMSILRRRTRLVAVWYVSGAPRARMGRVLGCDAWRGHSYERVRQFGLRLPDASIPKSRRGRQRRRYGSRLGRAEN